MTRSTDDEQLHSIRGFSQHHCRSADEPNRAYVNVEMSGLQVLNDQPLHRLGLEMLPIVVEAASRCGERAIAEHALEEVRI
jgi:hypothetical protein